VPQQQPTSLQQHHKRSFKAIQSNLLCSWHGQGLHSSQQAPARFCQRRGTGSVLQELHKGEQHSSSIFKNERLSSRLTAKVSRCTTQPPVQPHKQYCRCVTHWHMNMSHVHVQHLIAAAAAAQGTCRKWASCWAAHLDWLGIWVPGQHLCHRTSTNLLPQTVAHRCRTVDMQVCCGYNATVSARAHVCVLPPPPPYAPPYTPPLPPPCAHACVPPPPPPVPCGSGQGSRVGPHRVGTQPTRRKSRGEGRVGCPVPLHCAHLRSYLAQRQPQCR
jgi:hypothetical protein